MPFLVDAQAVTTLIVDPSRGRRHGEEPGADIALQLARHGVHLDVERVMSNGCPIAEVILHAPCGSDRTCLYSEPMVTLGCGNFCSEAQREPCSRKCLSPYLFRYNSAPSADRRVFAQSESFDWGGSDAHFGTGHLEAHGRTVPTVTGRAASDRLGGGAVFASRGVLPSQARALNHCSKGQPLCADAVLIATHLNGLSLHRPRGY